MSFSTELKRFRLSRLLTQAEFANAADVSISTYSAWERGVNLPSLQGFKLILRVDRDFPGGQTRLRDAYLQELGAATPQPAPDGLCEDDITSAYLAIHG